MTTTDKGRKTANKRSHNAAIWNKVSTIGATGRNVDLERGSGTWTSTAMLRFGKGKRKQRLDSRNELLRADLRLGDAGLYIHESHATQNPRSRSNHKQRTEAELKQKTEQAQAVASRQQPPKTPLLCVLRNSATTTRVQQPATTKEQRLTTSNNGNRKIA